MPEEPRTSRPARRSAAAGHILLLILALLLLGGPTAAQDEQTPASPGGLSRAMRGLRLEGRPEEAIALQAEASPLIQGDPRVLGEYTQALLDLDRVQEARQLLARIEIHPREIAVPLAVALMRSEFLRGDLTIVRRNVEMSLPKVPNNVDLRVLEVRLLTAERRWREAGSRLAKLGDELHPALRDELRVDLLLGRASEDLADETLADQALPLLEQAWQQAPGRGAVRGLYARALAQEQRADEAEELLLAGLEQATDDTDRTDLLCALGSVYHATGREADAQARFQQVLDEFPNQVQARIGMARCQAQQGDVRAGLELVGACLERRPDDQDALLAKAELEMDREGWPAAEKALRHLLDLVPDHLRALWLLSRVLPQQGKDDEADDLQARYVARKRELADLPAPAVAPAPADSSAGTPGEG